MHDDFLKDLASARPTPGGGGASAFAASIGAALLEKIIRLELGREGLSPLHDAIWQGTLRKTMDSKEALARLKVADGQSYLRWAEAKAGNVDEADLARLLLEAVETPLAIMEEAVQTLEAIPGAARLCKRHLLPDAMAVAELLAAAARGAGCITSANLARMKDVSRKSILHGRIDDLLERNEKAFAEVRAAISERS